MDWDHHDSRGAVLPLNSGYILTSRMPQQQLFERHPAVKAQRFRAKPADGPGCDFEDYSLLPVVAQLRVNRTVGETQGADRLFGCRDQSRRLEARRRDIDGLLEEGSIQ